MGLLEFSRSHPIPSLVMDPADVWKSSTDEAANAKKNHQNGHVLEDKSI